MRQSFYWGALVYLLIPSVHAQTFNPGNSDNGGIIVSVNPGGQPTSTSQGFITLVPGATGVPPPPSSPPPPGVDEPVEEPPNEEEEALQDAIEALCTGRVDQEAWLAAEMDQFTLEMSVMQCTNILQRGRF
jgi:hypothetical protein